MLAVDTPDTQKNNTLKRKSPLRFGHRVIVPSPQIDPDSERRGRRYVNGASERETKKTNKKQRNKEREQRVEQEQAKGTLGT